ncbi:MAG: 4-hydroxy-3-methylbut-2-enyl diphosphate reductase, partial [Eubacteriales bacterium]
MEITVAKYAGFCFGVERAVNTVYETIKKYPGKKIYTVGLLIHNPEIIKNLESLGVTAIDENETEDLLSEKSEGAVFVIRAHGVKKELAEKINEAGKGADIVLVDCTCPFVSKIHGIMDKHTSSETFTLLFGSESHPEIIGIASHIKGEYFIFDKSDTLEKAFSGFLKEKIAQKKVIMASQT